MSTKPISDVRRRMIEDMSVRNFGEKTQADYIRHVERFVKFLGRSPETATGEDLRRYQLHLVENGISSIMPNHTITALRFFVSAK